MVTPLFRPKMIAKMIALGKLLTRVIEIKDAVMMTSPPQNIHSVRYRSSIWPIIGIEIAAVIPLMVNIIVAVCASSPCVVRMLLKKT